MMTRLYLWHKLPQFQELASWKQTNPGTEELLLSRSVMSDSFAIPCTAAHQASLFFTISRSLLKLVSIESGMPSNHLSLCYPIPLLPSIFPCIWVFSKESALHIVWQSTGASVSASDLPMNSVDFLRTAWFNLLTVQETLKSLLQHHSSKESILQCSAFFMVQLLHLYMTTGNQRSNCQHPLDHRKSRRIPEKHLLLHWLCWSLWLCGLQLKTNCT